MKILQINSVCGVTGTGHIVTDLYDCAVEQGHECLIAYGEHKFHNNPGDRQFLEIGTPLDCQTHALATRLFDTQGFGSVRATRKLLKQIDAYHPDVIHLHNLHGYYINVAELFHYLKQKDVKVVWTLHDCWPFTGHCVHFQNVHCDKWQTECGHCPLTREYPASCGVDRSNHNFRKKKELFTGIKDMTILVPSHWLEERVQQSFLREYPIRVIYNGIDLNIYHPTASDFRTRYGLENKTIVLGVANVWTERKGLETFKELAQKLGEDYQVVLVGLNKQQIEMLPENMIGFPRTDTPTELAAIYTAADVFVNPSREETFGLTVAEAMACGTWPVVYDETACAEVVKAGMGQAVGGNVRQLLEAIRGYNRTKTTEEIAQAAKIFSKERFGQEVLSVYEEKCLS